jgi:hypothetical protein
MQAGPYDRLADNEPFLDVPPKPSTGGFYPPDMSREEFEQCCDKHLEDKDVFLSPYTLIKRQGNKMVAIPYHKAYEGLVGAMAQRLRFVQLHEIAHGLGPKYVYDTTTPVNVALRDLYSWIEENKADDYNQSDIYPANFLEIAKEYKNKNN